MTRRRSSDPVIAALLRDLPVPQHADDFFSRLRAQLYAEAETREEPASAVIDLSVRRDARRPERRRLQRLMQSATAAAAAVACFVLVVGGALLARRTTDDPPAPVSAATTAAAVPKPQDFRASKVRKLVVPQPVPAARTALRVRFRSGDVGRLERSYEAVIKPNGDYRISRAEPRVEASYRAKTGSRQLFQEATGGRPSEVVTETDPPPGPPDGPALFNPDRTLSRDLGAAARAIAAERPETVREVQWHGRPALELRQDGVGGDLFRTQYLLVDAETGFPLRVVQMLATGSTGHTLEVDTLDELPADEVPDVPVPTAAADIRSESDGFRDTTIEGAAEAAGYRPLVPLWAPSGFTLSKVTYAASVEPRSLQKNPRSEHVVSLVYRNGFDSFTVTTRRGAADATSTAWNNPLVDGTGLPDLTELARVDTGALAGADLHVGIYSVVWPHVWAERGGLVVTVAGDLTREQLLQVTGALQFAS